jgi:hypothetical protein
LPLQTGDLIVDIHDAIVNETEMCRTGLLVLGFQQPLGAEQV